MPRKSVYNSSNFKIENSWDNGSVCAVNVLPVIIRTAHGYMSELYKVNSSWGVRHRFGMLIANKEDANLDLQWRM